MELCRCDLRAASMTVNPYRSFTHTDPTAGRAKGWMGPGVTAWRHPLSYRDLKKLKKALLHTNSKSFNRMRLMCVLMPTETETQSCLRQCSTSGMSISSSVDTGRSADQSCSIGRHCCIKSVSTMCTAKKAVLYSGKQNMNYIYSFSGSWIAWTKLERK